MIIDTKVTTVNTRMYAILGYNCTRPLWYRYSLHRALEKKNTNTDYCPTIN